MEMYRVSIELPEEIKKALTELRKSEKFSGMADASLLKYLLKRGIDANKKMPKKPA